MQIRILKHINKRPNNSIRTLLNMLGVISKVAESVVSKKAASGGFSIARSANEAPTSTTSRPKITHANDSGSNPFTTNPN